MLGAISVPAPSSSTADAARAQSRDVDRASAAPFPGALQLVAGRVSARLGSHACDQVTVNDYPPGVGLNPHIDTHVRLCW